MKQNNRQLPDSKLLSLFSTWQQWHQTASVQLTAVAPALMNNLRLASLLCLAGTSGDTCPVWGGTGALCPRHTWQWRDKSVTCPSVIRSQSGVWAPDSPWLTISAGNTRTQWLMHTCTGTHHPLCKTTLQGRQSKGKQRYSKLFLKLSV